jgi:hypothetical protein
LGFLAIAFRAEAQAEEELIRGAAQKEGNIAFWSSMRIEDSRALEAGIRSEISLS